MQITKASVLGAFTILALVATVGSATKTPSLLASVNGQIITTAQWKQYTDVTSLLDPPALKGTSKKQQVKKLMEWTAVENWAIAHHWITHAKARSEAQRAITQMPRLFGGASAFKLAIKKHRVTNSELAAFMFQQEILQVAYTKVVKEVRSPTRKAENVFYMTHHFDFMVPQTDRVRAILVKSKSTAKTLESDLSSDKSTFSALANQYSLDKTSAKDGGELGTFTLSPSDDLPPALIQKMKTLKQGQYGIADTISGYYLIQVQAVKPAVEEPFSSVTSAIKVVLTTTNDSNAFRSFSEIILAKTKNRSYVK